MWHVQWTRHSRLDVTWATSVSEQNEQRYFIIITVSLVRQVLSAGNSMEVKREISEPNHDLNTGPSIDSLSPTKLQTWMLQFLMGGHMTQLWHAASSLKLYSYGQSHPNTYFQVLLAEYHSWVILKSKATSFEIVPRMCTSYYPALCCHHGQVATSVGIESVWLEFRMLWVHAKPSLGSEIVSLSL